MTVNDRFGRLSSQSGWELSKASGVAFACRDQKRAKELAMEAIYILEVCYGRDQPFVKRHCSELSILVENCTESRLQP